MTLDDAKNVEYKLTDEGDLLSVEGLSITQTKLELGFPDGWDAHLLRIQKRMGSDILVELWTDRASSGADDYMMGGFWLDDHPQYDDTWYGFGGTGPSRVESFFFRRDKDSRVLTNDGIRSFTGEATFKGIALGFLHKQDSSYSNHERQRLTGAVKLEADFGKAGEWGTLSGRINKLHLDGEAVKGQVKLSPGVSGAEATIDGLLFTDGEWRKVKRPGVSSAEATIDGIPFTDGDWRIRYSSVEGDQPTKAVGWVGTGERGNGVYLDGEGNTYSYEIIFGAKKAESNKP